MHSKSTTFTVIIHEKHFTDKYFTRTGYDAL